MPSRPVRLYSFSTSSYLLVVFCLLFAKSAYSTDQECTNYLKQIPDACNNSSDNTTGYDPPDSGTAASAQVSSAQSAVNAGGTAVSDQCKNQVALNNALTNSANLKVKACQNIMKKCEDSCNDAAKTHQMRAAATMNMAVKAQETSLMQQFQKDSKSCDQYSGNIATGQTSAAGTSANSGTSAACEKSTSTGMPAIPAITLPSTSGTDDTSAVATAGTPTLTYDTVATGAAGAGASVSSGATAANSAATGTTASVAATSPITSGVTGSTGSSGGSSDSSGSSSSSMLSSSKAQAAIPKNTSAEKVQKAGESNSNNTAVGGGGGGGFGGGGRDTADLAAKVAKAKSKTAVSGMSLKPVDGITGPVGATLFEKVSQQYQLQKHNLIHDPKDLQ